MMRVPKARHENPGAGRHRARSQGEQGEQGKQAKLAVEMCDSEAQTKFLMPVEPQASGT
jgi:hypothetical protein